MEQNKKENLQHFKIIHNKEFLQVQPLLSRFKTQILIDKINSTIVFQKKQKKFTYDSEPQTIVCSLILGILNIKESRYLVYVETVYNQPILEPGNQLIYQIANIDFIPFTRAEKGEQEAILLTLKKQVFSFGFYFCMNRDLTLKSEIYYSGSSNKSAKKFCWNEQMLQALAPGKNGEQWKIPIIQGYYGKFDNFQGKNKVTYFIIARRSKERSGTRFYSRGIDQNGHCSNTIETQQILVVGDIIMSNILISGSPPIFWQQKSQSKPIKLTRNKQLTKDPFIEHIKSLNSEYGNILLVNLLQYKKQSEKLLIQAYEQIFHQTRKQTEQCCRYMFYDLNEALKQGNYQSINDVVNHKLEEIINNFGCFFYDFRQKTIQAKQTGIFRISCLDCLRRTDIFMQCIALKSLHMQLNILGMQPISTFSVMQLIQNNEQEFNSFTKSFKQLWMVKADYESLIYTGTRAASGRKDKLLDQIDNSFVAIQRLYNEKFMDRMKQTVIDLLNPKNSSYSLKSNHSRSTSQFTIAISTWNVNATYPQKLNLDPIIEKFVKADLIVFGIQQMIDLQPNNVMLEQEQTQTAAMWEKQLSDKLAKRFNKKQYIFVQKIQMVGLLLIIFIRKDWKNAIRSVHKDNVKTGYGGSFGNKGGVVIRINIFDTSLCFTCAHLAAGESKLKERKDDFVQIHKKAFQQNKEGVQNQLQIEESDHRFFFGDLNFRIKGDFKSFTDLMEIVKKGQLSNIQSEVKKQISQLYERDQLLGLRMSPDTPYFLTVYEEQKIKFLPTYKLDKNTGYYTLQKSRNPSWCDRILYWTDSLEEHTCQCTEYSAINITGSDHRPVFGRFTVSVIKQQPKRDSLRDFGQQLIGKEFRDSYFE